MPKKLPAAAVGALAAGLTMPFAASAAEAAPAPAAPPPMTGSAAAGAPSWSQPTVITASRNSGQFVQPLTGAYTFSTGYGPRCSPNPGASSYHMGQDLVAPEGTPFQAIAAGTVVSTQDGTASRAGHVMIRHNVGGKTYHSRYLHVWDGTSHVRTGDTVRAGQTIGLVGNSGLSSTPHLHLEIWEGAWHSGTALDPQTFMSERGVNLRAAAAREYFPSQCDDSSDSGGSEPAGGSSGSGSSGQTRQVTQGLNLRSGAGNTHSVIGGMAAGEQVTVRSTSGAWVQVRRSNGQTGWAHSAYLRGGGSSASSSGSGFSGSGSSNSGSSGSSSAGSSGS
ncbi:peptidoglycan DD-metalloendopeptidase family protein, partial [Nesterenkonia muleiensis]|uniref:peptidoglycan DD-metalloendopeptidase family protein n=1 Tax=Nesterenkonia muleiensis TaxID=2282648 RepID=UPI001300B453